MIRKSVSGHQVTFFTPNNDKCHYLKLNFFVKVLSDRSDEVKKSRAEFNEEFQAKKFKPIKTHTSNLPSTTKISPSYPYRAFRYGRLC
jgi:hypothetical protein